MTTPIIKPVLSLLPLLTGGDGGGRYAPAVGQPVGDVGGGAEKLIVAGGSDESDAALASPDAVSSSAPQFVQKRIPSALSLPHFPHLNIETPSHSEAWSHPRKTESLDAHEA
jgi:hypothetical protein